MSIVDVVGDFDFVRVTVASAKTTNKEVARGVQDEEKVLDEEEIESSREVESSREIESSREVESSREGDLGVLGTSERDGEDLEQGGLQDQEVSYVDDSILFSPR